MVKLIIFDFDGVILPGIERSYEVCKRQRPALTVDEYRSWFDGNIHTYLLENRVALNLLTFFNEYNDAITKAPFEPAIKNLLGEAAEHAALAIVSSNSSKAIERYLASNGVREKFSEVWGAEQHKSKVEKLRLLQQIHGVAPAECRFVTDTLGDLKEAAEAGVAAIGVTWGFHSRERLLAGAPLAIAETPHELRELLLVPAARGAVE
jgi:phosphoglycolate phosphatase